MKNKLMFCVFLGLISTFQIQCNELEPFFLTEETKHLQIVDTENKRDWLKETVMNSGDFIVLYACPPDTEPSFFVGILGYEGMGSVRVDLVQTDQGLIGVRQYSTFVDGKKVVKKGGSMILYQSCLTKELVPVKPLEDLV